MEQINYWKQQGKKLAAQIQEQAKSPKEEAALLRSLFDAMTDTLQEKTSVTDYISAQNSVVEIIDRQTGTLYRRYLELEYQENDNGIRLLGEDMSGQPVQIVFLSTNALHKMHDLRGKGPDEPHHKHD